MFAVEDKNRGGVSKNYDFLKAAPKNLATTKY